MTVDSYAFFARNSRGEHKDTVLVMNDADTRLFCVIDSNTALDSETVVTKSLNDSLKPLTTDEVTEDRVNEAFETANKTIISGSEENAAEIKVSAAALCFFKDRVYWNHIGSARVYQIHNDEIHSVTADHTEAYRLLEQNRVARNMLVVHEERRELYKYLGKESPDGYDAVSDTAESGDAFLLCTDGFWEYIMDNEILIDYHKADSPKSWAKLLLLRVMERLPEEYDGLSLITLML